MYKHMKTNSNVWYCVAGGILMGTGLGYVLSKWNEKKTKERSKSREAFVLCVTLRFEEVQDKEDWKKRWAQCATMVYEREKNCLSYEACDSVEDPKTLIIYERYRSRSDLDGLHQETLNLFRKHAIMKYNGKPPKVTKSFYVETNIGFMERPKISTTVDADVSEIWNDTYYEQGGAKGFTVRKPPSVDVMLEKWDKGSSEPPHSHPGDDCTIVVNGRMSVQFFKGNRRPLTKDGPPLVLNAGDVGYIKANRIHSVKYEEDCILVYLHNKTFGFKEAKDDDDDDDDSM